jgi:hypothetical protein
VLSVKRLECRTSSVKALFVNQEKFGLSKNTEFRARE